MNDEMTPKPEHYLNNTTLLMKVLRFFNLLEPGRAVVSVSKLMMWTTLALVVYIALYERQNIAAILGAVGAFTGSVGNYAWRRHKGATP